jgi:translation initiation factor 4A
MNAGTKLAALNKFRAPGPTIVPRPSIKVLVVYDVQVKTPDVPHVPLVINYGWCLVNTLTVEC